MTRKITIVLILTTIAVWVGWDIFAAVEPTPGDTESEVLRDWGHAHASLPFALGALMGHFFGTWDRLVELRARFPVAPVVLAGLGGVVVAADLGGALPEVHPLIPFLVGVPLGAALWPLASPPFPSSDESVEEEIAEVVRMMEDSEPLICPTAEDDDAS